MCQGAVNRFRSGINPADIVDVNDRALELLMRDLREPVADILKRDVIDRVSGNFSPPCDPEPAELAFAIPDYERLRRRTGNARTRLVRHQHPTSNAQPPTSNSDSDFDIRCSALDI